ncbi:MAG TPA: YidC/Oxa1 family membrane protein insertase, partial [Terrimicrobiaceae bacterium]|nr:YidC/Oxa1 family membrane protein insertase [Terrimicrobiaceae bacterium]
VSEFLLWTMNKLNGVFHSYAAAIIILTIIIKTLLWPIQNRATNQLRKMSLLTPKMTELREKYKDDPQKMNEEVMKLYREYGVNPFSGCVPMLIQIPIFFGFYAMLGSAIELRNSSFLWVQDLSQPDTVFRIGGFPVNVLPIVMAGSMIWQMAISPKSGDAMQQRIFYFMPVIFLVFCYNYASGLALYWTTQNLFSIVQLYLTRNKPLPTLEKKSVVAKREAAIVKKRKRRAAS